MPFADPVRIVLATAFSGTLFWAAISDIRTRKIPNAAILTLLVLFLGWVATDISAAFSALEAAGIGLAVTVSLYAFKIIGAGDSKLFAAAALFVGMGYLPYFALATALAGGVLAVVSLASQPQRALAMFNLRGKGDAGSGVPYGAAIALGGVLIVWAAQIGQLEPYSYGRGPQPTVQGISQSMQTHSGR